MNKSKQQEERFTLSVCDDEGLILNSEDAGTAAEVVNTGQAHKDISDPRVTDMAVIKSVYEEGEVVSEKVFQVIKGDESPFLKGISIREERREQ